MCHPYLLFFLLAFTGIVLIAYEFIRHIKKYRDCKIENIEDLAIVVIITIITMSMLTSVILAAYLKELLVGWKSVIFGKEFNMEILLATYFISALVTAMFFTLNSNELMVKYLNDKKMYTKGLVMSVLIPVVNTVIAILAIAGLLFKWYHILRKKFS